MLGLSLVWPRDPLYVGNEVLYNSGWILISKRYTPFHVLYESLLLF